MGSNYNKVPRPAVVFVADGLARQVVRRGRSTICCATTAEQRRLGSAAYRYRQPPRAADLPGDQVTASGSAREKTGKRASHDLQRDPHLHAGQVRPDAAVDAKAERGVAVHLAVDHDLAGASNCAGSRLAAGNDSRIQSSAFIGSPASPCPP